MTRLHDELQTQLPASTVESAMRWAAAQTLVDVIVWVT